MSAGGLAVVVGSSGGIGGAFVRAAEASGRYRAVLALSRQGTEPEAARWRGKIDLYDEASIAAVVHGPIAQQQMQVEGGAAIRLILVASGGLQGEGIGPPERSFRALDGDSLVNSYRLNAVGPALVAKHMLPLLPRVGRSVFAVLSARVGSIGDNRLGGWHGYRASKAALNMIVRNLAIELARTHPEAICIGLHPGTVATKLSRPFQGNVAKEKLFTPEQSAACLLEVIATVSVAQTGLLLAFDGTVITP